MAQMDRALLPTSTLSRIGDSADRSKSLDTSSPHRGSVGSSAVLYSRQLPTVDSRKLELGCGMIYVGSPSFFGLWLEGGHAPTFWLPL